MRAADYLKLLDWTARQSVPGQHRTAAGAPPILVRLGLDGATWCELVKEFVQAAFDQASEAGTYAAKPPTKQLRRQTVSYVRDRNGYLVKIYSSLGT
tara:strand:- start:282 stop:572 length:291 start_codon:yes stop_codon:yes gene_type:complete